MGRGGWERGKKGHFHALVLCQGRILSSVGYPPRWLTSQGCACMRVYDGCACLRAYDGCACLRVYVCVGWGRVRMSGGVLCVGLWTLVCGISVNSVVETSSV